MTYLAIDLGSTHFKAALYDEQLLRRGLGVFTVKHHYHSGGRVELDVDHVIEGFHEMIAAVLRDAEINPANISRIAITSQAQTFTILDQNDQPKIPFISWQDSRALEDCEEMIQLGELQNFADHSSFGSLLPPLQVCVLRHIQNSQLGLIAKADRIVPLPTFLIYLLTGRFATDQNIAAMSGLYSIPLGAWWPDALHACRLDSSQLPALFPIGASVGVTTPQAAEFGLPEGIPVISAGNDQTSGAYGAQIHENNAILLTLGTAQIVYSCMAAEPHSAPSVVRGPYPGNRYYKLSADQWGGNLIGWARGILAHCDSYDDFFNLAQTAPKGAGGLVFTADLNMGSGRWDNIALDHTPAHFARSVIECLARRMKQMIADLDLELAERPILVAGGGNRQPLWLDILSQELNTKVRPIEADPLLGAAHFAKEA